MRQSRTPRPGCALLPALKRLSLSEKWDTQVANGLLSVRTRRQEMLGRNEQMPGQWDLPTDPSFSAPDVPCLGLYHARRSANM